MYIANVEINICVIFTYSLNSAHYCFVGMSQSVQDFVSPLKVTALKDELKKRGLSTYGNKAALQQRLTEALQSDEGKYLDCCCIARYMICSISACSLLLPYQNLYCILVHECFIVTITDTQGITNLWLNHFWQMSFVECLVKCLTMIHICYASYTCINVQQRSLHLREEMTKDCC